MQTGRIIGTAMADNFGSYSLGRFFTGQRATIDTARSPTLSLVAPVDARDTAAVAKVLDLSIKVGAALLDAGTGAADTAAQVRFVAATYGLENLEVDVTYNAIIVSAQLGPDTPPVSSMRLVHYRTLDFSRLAAIDTMVRRIRSGSLSPDEAHKTVETITTAPHPYSPWYAVAAWAVMAAAVSALLGGSLVVSCITLVTAFVIYITTRLLNRAKLPAFFQQLIGGFIAVIPAATFYRFQDTLGAHIRPSQVIAAGVIVLLAGLSLVGAIQDAITGAPVTASARLLEVLMLTGGIVAGVGIAIRFVGAFNISLPTTENYQPALAFNQMPVALIAGGVTSAAFAVACYAGTRALVISGISGLAGTFVLAICLRCGIGSVVASGIAATVVGLAGGLLARRALTPPLIVAVAGITPLLPGLSIYRGLSAILNDQIVVGMTALAAAIGSSCALAAGVTLGEWCARTLRRPRFSLSSVDVGSTARVRPQIRMEKRGSKRRTTVIDDPEAAADDGSLPRSWS